MTNECFELYKDLPLKIVNKHYSGFLMNYKDDLYNQAYLLLFQAYKNFDKEKGTKFESFAYTYIYYGISRYLDVNLQGHQRRNVKQSNGHFKMEITKPTFISMNTERETTTSETIDLSFFQGENDENYDDVELRLTLKKVIVDLKNKSKYEKRYQHCGEILEYILNQDLSHKEIIEKIGIYHTTYYRKLQLLRDYIKNNYSEVISNGY